MADIIGERAAGTLTLNNNKLYKKEGATCRNERTRLGKKKGKNKRPQGGLRSAADEIQSSQVGRAKDAERIYRQAIAL